MIERKHVTEIYDLLCDLNFNGSTRYQYITTSIPEQNYTGGIVNYDPATKRWSLCVPGVNYEYSYIGFKAFKTIPFTGTNPNKIFYCCAQANNSNKRVAFDSSNLTDGIEVSPINQVNILEFWLEDPIYKKYYSLNEVSQYYYNLILELDFYIRQ